MKKWLFLALTAALSVSVQAANLTEGKQYVVVEGQQQSAQPEVLEFFHKKLARACRKARHSSNITWIF